MKHITKGTLVAFLCLVLMLCLFPAFTAADASGQCGDNLYWSFNSSTGKLTITGSGPMEAYNQRSSVPWDSIRDRITSVSLPQGLTSICFAAFSTCRNLTSVTIPNTVTWIGPLAFGHCSNLTAISVEDGNNHYLAEDGVVYSYDRQTIVAYPAGKTKNVYSVPYGVTSIFYGAFSGSSNLSSIVLPNSVTDIGICAFSYCKGITDMTIPKDVSIIGKEAFSNCTGLKSVTIPVNTTIIDQRAFMRCSNLKDVYYQGTEEQWKAIQIEEDNDPLLNVTWHYLPGITTQPVDVTAALGSTASFKVVGTGAESYQWQYQKPGDSTWYDVQNNGKSATFNQTNIEKRHNGFVFRCKVTNSIGSTYSNTAKLTVPTTAPTISSQPASVTKDLGTTASFTVAASNATSYQWQYQIPGSSAWNDVKNNGKSATFNQTNVEKRHNGYLFRCKVTNSIGSAYSNTAKLTVPTTAPTISSHPASVTKDLGATATFKVVATGATSYQWQYQKPGNATWYDVQNNGKSATFNQTNLEKRHNGFVFRCKVTNAVGSVYSNTAKLTVPTTAPTISSQPSYVTKDLGTTATFKVTASNATSYQWQYQKPGDSTWYDVQNNGKSATFNQTNCEKRHNGFVFRCKVTNALGSTYSNTAKLTVN